MEGMKEGRRQVSDPRDQTRVVHPLSGMLALGTFALGSGARSARSVESRSEQLRPQVRKEIGIEERVSDNAFGLALRRIDHFDVRDAVIRQNKREWERKNLRPVSLPWSTVAFDGKHLATLNEKDLRGLVTSETGLDGDALSVGELRRILDSRFEYVQFREHDDGRIDGLLRAHRATLISSDAAVALDQWPIKGKTNESGTIELTLQCFFRAYGRMKIAELVTFDAGNSKPESAKKVRDHGADYFMAIKQSQGALHTLALTSLGELDATQAKLSTNTNERGKTICYTVWTHELDEETYGFKDARQLIRIERVAIGDDDDEPQVGNRYFVCSKPTDELTAEHALTVARHHWRCENESHWTSDAIFDEDARRTPWTRHPNGILTVSLLRCMAINILAVLRASSRIPQGKKWLKPAWMECVEQALMVLFEPLLDMEEFNACEC